MKKVKNKDMVIDVSREKLDEDAAQEVVMSGKLNIGKGGNPVTITVEDEVTGEVMEINNVGSALLMVEEVRRSSSGWISMIFGDLGKVAGVLGFMSKMTLAGLEKMKRGN